MAAYGEQPNFELDDVNEIEPFDTIGRWFEKGWEGLKGIFGQAQREVENANVGQKLSELRNTLQQAAQNAENKIAGAASDVKSAYDSSDIRTKLDSVVQQTEQKLKEAANTVSDAAQKGASAVANYDYAQAAHNVNAQLQQVGQNVQQAYQGSALQGAVNTTENAVKSGISTVQNANYQGMYNQATSTIGSVAGQARDLAGQFGNTVQQQASQFGNTVQQAANTTATNFQSATAGYWKADGDDDLYADNVEVAMGSAVVVEEGAGAAYEAEEEIVFASTADSFEEETTL